MCVTNQLCSWICDAWAPRFGDYPNIVTRKERCSELLYLLGFGVCVKNLKREVSDNSLRAELLDKPSSASLLFNDEVGDL
jgi:hypothetical protein